MGKGIGLVMCSSENFACKQSTTNRRLSGRQGYEGRKKDWVTDVQSEEGEDGNG